MRSVSFMTTSTRSRALYRIGECVALRPIRASVFERIAICSGFFDNLRNLKALIGSQELESLHRNFG